MIGLRVIVALPGLFDGLPEVHGLFHVLRLGGLSAVVLRGEPGVGELVDVGVVLVVGLDVERAEGAVVRGRGLHHLVGLHALRDREALLTAWAL